MWILEASDHVASIMVLVVSAFALYQIKLAKDAAVSAQANLKLTADSIDLAKEDIKLRSTREAVTLAAEQCERFAGKLQEIQRRISNMYQHGLPEIQWTLKNDSFDGETIGEDSASWMKAAERFSLDIGYILNQLEAFAIYFDKGAADEQVAYGSTGIVFCDIAERMAPFIVSIREGNTRSSVVSGPFQSTVNMYKVWASRLKSEYLQSQVDAMQEEMGGLETAPRKPIGTE